MLIDILYGGNVFRHTTMRNDFLMLGLYDCHNNSNSVFVSHAYFDFE